MCITGSSASLSALSKALIVALVLVFAGCDSRLSRDEFASRVTGKSTSEVEAGLGKPDTVDESVAGTVGVERDSVKARHAPLPPGG